MPFQPFTPPPASWAPPLRPPVREDLAQPIAVGLAAVGVIAGKNHYDETGDLGVAVYEGGKSMLYWWVWASMVCVWLFAFGMAAVFGVYVSSKVEFIDEDISGALWQCLYTLLISPFALGVTYCRMIDASLMRRGGLYRLYAPLARRVEKVPTIALYALLFFCFTS